MYKHLVISVGLFSGLACVYAQPTINTWQIDSDISGKHSAEQTRAQRQAELRSALRAQRSDDNQMANIRGERQLTAQERSELRQQLRQQRYERKQK